MYYINTVNLVFSILFIIASLMYGYFIIFAIVGLFAKKKFKKTDKLGKYGILVSARNEAGVISNLIKSIRLNNYPQDNLQVFVVAHNCTDKTADSARNEGAVVYEYNNPNEKTKGYALKYLVKCIKNDYGTENFDGFFVFDADNILSKNYFEKMNDAFMAYDKKRVITSFRNSKNFGTNLMSGLYGIYFMTGCRFEMRGRTVTDCSSRVSGTGFVFSSDVVKDGWNYVTLTEDWELTADRIIQGSKISYCDEAELYDEQPTNFKIMWRQRVRWSKGHLLVCLTRFKDLIKSFFSFKKEHKQKVSIYDYTMNIMPFCLIFTALTVVQVIMLMFAPIAGVKFWTAMGGWAKAFALTCLTSYLATFIQAIVLFVVERKRIHGVSFWKKVALVLIWPFFLMIQFIIDIQALFSRNLTWKTIPHNDTTTIESLTRPDHITENQHEKEVEENSEI